MDFPLERSLEDCLKAVEVKSLSRYFDDQLDAAEELYGIQLHFNFNTNDVKVLIDSYRIAYSQEICVTAAKLLYAARCCITDILLDRLNAGQSEPLGKKRQD